MHRRQFLQYGSTCAAHLGLFGALPIRGWQITAESANRPVVEEPWGRVELIADGVWALVSTPLAGGAQAMRTFSNGGIVAGKSGVVVVEGFASSDGARWMTELARKLTGRLPTHVVLTHYHGDHSGGLLGYLDASSRPLYVTTAETIARLKDGRQNLADAMADAQLVRASVPTTLDLGGRRVTVTPRSGHTSSDLTAHVDDPAVLFGGDLLWNHHFPNYMDALPSVLSREVRALSAEKNVIRVPGHGAIFNDADLANYVGVLDTVEEAARKAHKSGLSTSEAAKTFTLPATLGEWTLFGNSYFEVALRAWERELA